MGLITRPRDVEDPFYRSTSKDYSHAYDTIVRAARSGHRAGSSSFAYSSAPILLLVSTDIDAICAARILISLLNNDDVPYKLCPVDGYSTLTRIVEEEVETNSEVSQFYSCCLVFALLRQFRGLASHHCHAQHGLHSFTSRLFHLSIRSNPRRSHTSQSLPYSFDRLTSTI